MYFRYPSEFEKTALVGGLLRVGSAAWNAAKPAAQNAWKNALPAAKNAWNTMQPKLNNAWNSARTGMTNMWNAAKKQYRIGERAAALRRARGLGAGPFGGSNNG